MEAAKPLNFRLSAGMFGGKRTLRLAPDFFEYGRETSDNNLYARVRKEEIADIKHSMSWIIWYRFYVGCNFNIEIKTHEGNIVKIRFSAYFGKIGAYQKMYADIINWMWDYYLNDIVNTHLKRFKTSPNINIGGLRLTEKGVHLLDKDQTISWPNVAVKEYENYFAVYNQENPEINRRIEFGEWESETLLGMLEDLKADNV